MDINKMTQKSQEALQNAQNTAVQFGHQEIAPEHLLFALLQDETGLVPRLLNKINIPILTFKEKLQNLISKLPRVSGPGMTPDKFYISQQLSALLVSAEGEMKQLKDEYLSVEHIILAIIATGSSTPTGKIFSDLNVDKNQFLSALTEIRGNQRITSANPEQTYEALEKKINEIEKQGKNSRLR